jgi:hypothetical protein
MTARPAHFVQLADESFQPTKFAQSHWGADHLNGPALVGLAAAVLDERYGDADLMPARVTVDLFKAARGVPTTAVTRVVRDGRRVRNTECELVQDGVTVVRAILVQYRRSQPPRGHEWVAEHDFIPPADLDSDGSVHISSDGHGWSCAIADHQNDARKRFMNKPVDAIEGRKNTPLVNAAMAAEGTSLVTNLGTAGVGYINGDLTVSLARLPLDSWIGVQADSHWTDDGISVGSATLYDSVGAFGTGMVTAVSNLAAQIDFTNDPFPDRTR